jgi:hypothetical protein
MRNELHEPGHGFFSAARREALNAPAVDAALADESAVPIVTERGSRRDLSSHADAERRSLDVPHLVDMPAIREAAGDGALLRQLSHQLTSLQAQQYQIRRLLEQAECRRATSIDRSINSILKGIGG